MLILLLSTLVSYIHVLNTVHIVCPAGVFLSCFSSLLWFSHFLLKSFSIKCLYCTPLLWWIMAPFCVSFTISTSYISLPCVSTASFVCAVIPGTEGPSPSSPDMSLLAHSSRRQPAVEGEMQRRRWASSLCSRCRQKTCCHPAGAFWSHHCRCGCTCFQNKLLD